MTFAHPTLLFALALGLIPIIIYYLMRFRSLKVPWGANYVLERALARLKKKLFLDQFLLLALRVLALLALVCAFARPLLQSHNTSLSGTGVHRVILIDGSYSMLAGEGDESAWRRGMDIVKRLTATWGRGEKWSLCRVGRDVEWVVSDELVTTAEASHRVLDKLSPEETRISMAVAMEEVLARSAGRSTEIYLVSDDQAGTWEGVEKINPDSGVRLFWVNVSTKDRRNLAVTGVQVSQQRVLVGHPCRVFVRVRNFAETVVEDAEIDILVDGRHVAKQRLSMLPGQDAWAHVDVMLDAVGSHYVTARLADDVLVFDNQLSAGLEVRESISVLVLKDEAKNAKFDSSYGFINLLAETVVPSGSSSEALGNERRIHVSACSGEKCSLAKMQEVDIVVVDGGTSVSPVLVKTLSEFVQGGGCLLLAPDDTVNVQLWNEQFGASRLLPAGLAQLHAGPLGGDIFQSISKTGFNAPSLKQFETGQDGDIGTVKFYSWFDLTVSDDRSAVLAELSNGNPFAVAQRHHPGAVLMLAAGINCRNNSLIVRETGYALLTRLFMAGRSSASYNLTVDRSEAIHLRVEGPDDPAGVQFSQDGQTPRSLLVGTTASGRVATLPGGAGHSGLGSLIVVGASSHERVWYGVQGVRMDSDLRGVDAAAMTRIKERFDLEEVASWEALDSVLAGSQRGRDVYASVIAILLILAVGEMLMQRKFV